MTNVCSTTRTKWLQFEREDSPKRKTPMVWVYNHDGDCLGCIKWYSQWRQFCLVIENDSYEPMKLIYAKSCLDDIAAMIAQLTRERSDGFPCSKCGKDRHGYSHPDYLCRYCAGEAE